MRSIPPDLSVPMQNCPTLPIENFSTWAKCGFFELPMLSQEQHLEISFLFVGLSIRAIARVIPFDAISINRPSASPVAYGPRA